MLLTKNARNHVALASLSLLLAGMVAAPPAALSLPGGNKQNFQLPANSSLDEAAAEVGDTASGDEPKPGTVLAPLKLTGDEAPAPKKSSSRSKPAPAPKAESGENKTFKLEESKNEFVPKGPAGEDSLGAAAESVVTPKKAKASSKEEKKKISKDETVTNENVANKAAQVNATPLALQSSAAETIQKTDQLENSEQKQIAQLWEATLQRSPDIQFVVQKLVPTSDPNHTSTVMMRLVTSALYAGVGAFGTVMPGQSTYAMQNGAAQVLGQISGVVDSKNAKKAVLNQSELIALYQMVRNTADKMVDHYRDYKKFTVSLQRASADLEDLRAMAADSTARPLETEYTLRKQKRDIDCLADDVHRYRSNLIDLAGTEAVDKLDQDIARELQMLGETSVAVNGAEQQKVNMNFTLPTNKKMAEKAKPAPETQM